MPLKALVKVGGISNLGDARYCAGMGVDMLGISVTTGHSDYLPASLYQEIRGWVSGPKFVAEVYNAIGETDLNEIIAKYQPDYIETDAVIFADLRHLTSLPFIVRSAILPSIRGDYSSVENFIVPFSAFTGSCDRDNAKFLIEVTSVEETQKIIGAGAGIALRATPGAASGDSLADVLSFLDADD